MMGERGVMQETLFYGFSLERHVPDDHLLRKIDRFLDLSDARARLGSYCSDIGRPSNRSRADDPNVSRRLRLRASFGASRRSPRTATAASAGERSPAQAVRARGGALH